MRVRGTFILALFLLFPVKIPLKRKSPVEKAKETVIEIKKMKKIEKRKLKRRKRKKDAFIDRDGDGVNDLLMKEKTKKILREILDIINKKD